MNHRLDDPRHPYPKRPIRDEASELVLDQAVHSLQLLRAAMYYGDAGLELHALTSLRAEIDARIPHVVADARDQKHHLDRHRRPTRTHRQPGPPPLPRRRLSTPLDHRTVGAYRRPRITGISWKHHPGSPA